MPRTRTPQGFTIGTCLPVFQRRRAVSNKFRVTVPVAAKLTVPVSLGSAGGCAIRR